MHKIAIIIAVAAAVSGAVAAFSPAKNPRDAQATTIDPAAMMREAKDLPVGPAYPAF